MMYTHIIMLLNLDVDGTLDKARRPRRTAPPDEGTISRTSSEGDFSLMGRHRVASSRNIAEHRHRLEWDLRATELVRREAVPVTALFALGVAFREDLCTVSRFAQFRKKANETYGVVSGLVADAFRQTGDGLGTHSAGCSGDGLGPALVRAVCCELVRVLLEVGGSTLTGDALDKHGLEQNGEEQDRQPERESSAGHGEMRVGVDKG